MTTTNNPENPLGWFDENAVYKTDVQLEDPDPENGTLWLDLYEQKGERDGAVRFYTKGDGSSSLIISEEKSDYSLSVDRLVWVDGHRQPPKDTEDAMTLVVLQLAFETSRNGSDDKIGFAEAELRFQSDKKDGLDPEVVAWGPFRRPETWNVSKAHRRVNRKDDVTLAAGWAGQQLSVQRGRESETSWDQIDFDQGTSTRLYSDSKGTPHGVRWKLQENQLYRKGIMQGVRVAVLLRRKQKLQPYRATFRIAVRTGVLSAFKNRSKAFLKLPVGKEVRWLTTPEPGSKKRCSNDGAEIVKHIDLDNLGELTDPSDSTKLNASWLRTNADMGAAGDAEVVSTAEEAASDSQMNAVPTAVDHSTAPLLPTQAPESSASVLHPAASMPAGICSGPGVFFPPPGVDHQGYNRLVSLEARAAQAETRLAAQDILIFKLQQAMARLEAGRDY